MKNVLLAVMILFFSVAGVAMAADSATQTVTYAVSAINEISVSGNPAAMTVSAATAGSAPNSVSDTSTTFAITTNGTNKKITGAINTAMPAGLTLTVGLDALTGSTSAGEVTLGTSAADLVTGISTLNESSKTITYGLSATSAAGVVTSANKTVTLTVADGL
jgi:hypothetical protein